MDTPQVLATSQLESRCEDIPPGRKKLNLNAIPSQGPFLSIIDLDLTVACNLRCRYCFKEKWSEHMEEQVAFDAIVWLLYASGPVEQLYVNFMGGEPMLRFPLIKRLVPFAKRRAWRVGKTIHFGITTNCTLVTDEVVDFWKQWGMGFHTSIDGTPEIQDHNRPTADRQGSSRLVEHAVPKILACRPMTMARSTVVPEGAGSLVDNYKYFRSLGYKNIGFATAGHDLWSEEAVATFEAEWSKLGDIVIDEYRAGRQVYLSGIDVVVEAIIRNERYQHLCGAGRGTVLIDIHGDIWPCHRWSKKAEGAWRIGNIYRQFDDAVRSQLDVPSQAKLVEEDCETCVAALVCSGGCPAENLEETGCPFKRHETACKLTRIITRVGQRVHDVLYGEGNELFMKQYYNRQEQAA